MKRLVMALAVAGILVSASATGATAKTTKTEVAGTATVTQVLGIGSDVTVGSVRSVRGLVQLENNVWNSSYLSGLSINVVNFDLDLATGQGELWGSGHHSVTAEPDGGWDCVFHAVFVDYAYSGKGVCHGTGTLHTWQWRADLHMIDDTSTGFTGYFFQPGH
jgi:hypothetical protein